MSDAITVYRRHGKKPMVFLRDCFKDISGYFCRTRQNVHVNEEEGLKPKRAPAAEVCKRMGPDNAQDEDGNPVCAPEPLDLQDEILCLRHDYGLLEDCIAKIEARLAALEDNSC